MSDQQLWKLIDWTSQGIPFYLDLEHDHCYYAREYISHGGFQYPGNDRIDNFKKKNSFKGKPAWNYKIWAVKEFAKELAGFIPDNGILATIPTSKVSSDPNYDERFDMLKAEIQRIRPDIVFVEPVSLKENVQAAHLGGNRDPLIIAKSYEYAGFPSSAPERIYVLDDVISSGGHFKAYKNILADHHPTMIVEGVFWALTVRRNP